VLCAVHSAPTRSVPEVSLSHSLCRGPFSVVAAFSRFGEVCRVLETACQNAGLSLHEINVLKHA
jgi:hypothetical protein